MRTPRLDESMNVVAVRSTITVERPVGAGGEHAHHAAEDRTDERPGGDRDGRRGLGHGHTTSSLGLHGKIMARRLPRGEPGSIFTDSASAAMSARPRPG